MAPIKRRSRWMQQHRRDPFVQRAQREGFRSRAVYKLIAVDEKDQLLRPGQIVVDLGAAPGAWSQWASQRVGPSGQVLALDRLPMAPIAGVTFIEGELQAESVQKALLSTLGERHADVVLSDLAPNLSGITSIDQPRVMQLAEEALALAEEILRPGGDFLVKLFQGAGVDAYLRSVRGRFSRVSIRKPPASRAKSSEVYWVCKGLHKAYVIGKPN